MTGCVKFHVAFLQMRCVCNVRDGRRVPRIRGVSETRENRLHQPLEVEQRQVSPKRGTELLVPIENGLGRRKRVGSSTKKLSIEHAIPVGVGYHEIYHLEGFAIELKTIVSGVLYQYP